MSTMNISLPEELKAFVDRQVGSGGYTSNSEYVREVLRREKDREHLRSLLLDGMSSPLVEVADGAYFKGLRDRIRERAATNAARADAVTSPAKSRAVPKKA